MNSKPSTTKPVVKVAPKIAPKIAPKVAPKAVAPEPELDLDQEANVEDTPNAGKIVWMNQVQLTVHLKEANINEPQTFAWGKAFLSMGKDDQGVYKPSLWLKIKAFGKENPALPALLVAYEPGAVITVTGRLAYEVTPGEGDKVFKDVVVVASDITDPEFVA